MNAPFNPRPFHDGELRAHVAAGTGTPGAAIREVMPDQHRQFFSSLRFALLATTDKDGWPVATIVTGPQGFITSVNPQNLSIDASAHWQDSFAGLLERDKAIGMLGIEFSTRRRNRANGHVVAFDENGLRVHVEQSFGNCPKYIQSREVSNENHHQPVASREFFTDLTDAAKKMINDADTFFVATASGKDATNGSGVDISHRGGMPGFIRMDGDTLTIPDFVGNRYFNTLGNMLVEPRAALLFVDFITGDLLHLQGTTEVLWESDERENLAGAERLWRFHITSGWKKSNAIPLQWTLREFAPTTAATGIWSKQD
jgi:predicted pyridoxine 5'-phosphate oxidase superfamily flavin-nucleotide-binding protein